MYLTLTANLIMKLKDLYGFTEMSMLVSVCVNFLVFMNHFSEIFPQGQRILISVMCLTIWYCPLSSVVWKPLFKGR